jgi:hypothetical protein
MRPLLIAAGPLLALLGEGAPAVWATSGRHAPVREARRQADAWRH